MQGLLIVLGVAALTCFAPLILGIITYVRIRGLRAEMESLRDRVRQLERGAATLPPEGGSHATVPSAADVRPPEGGSTTVPLTADRSYLPPPPPSGFRLQAEGQSATEEPELESLENRIGGRWLLYVGVAAIVIGIAYFEKLAIDNQWIGETARVIQGGVLGAILVYAGTRFAKAGYRAYGQMIAGGGIAAMYVSTYAAFNYYHLIDRPVAFALLAAITVLGAFLADREDSQGLAIFAVGGGFVTPFLLPSDHDAQIALFTYDAILIGGTVFLAGRRSWPFLHVVSYVFTLITVAGWADRFYEPSKYLPTELFLTLFCAMFVAIARWCRRDGQPAARFAAYFLWTAPVAYYLASLVVLEPHPVALLVWLIGVMLVGAVASVRVGPWAGLSAWLAVAAPLLAWTQVYGGPVWLAPGLATIAGVYLISLAAQLQVMAAGNRMRPVEIAWMHLNGLLMFAAAYFLLEKTQLSVTGPLAAVFAAWHGILSIGLINRDRDRALHLAALAFSLLAVAVALQFDGPAVTVAWAAEGTALIALGLYERREWLRAGGAILFTIAVVRTLELLVSVAPANHVLMLNPRAACAATVIALCYLIAWLHRTRTIRAGATAAILAAQLVSVVLLTTEIRAFFPFGESTLTREMTISVTWAAYATVLIVVGLYKRYAPIRYFGIGLFAITIVKVFFADLAQLDRIYRVLSIMGLGVLLLLTSYLYQRMRGATSGAEAAGNGPARAPD